MGLMARQGMLARSAVTGRFVSLAYASVHPAMTVVTLKPNRSNRAIANGEVCKPGLGPCET